MTVSIIIPTYNRADTLEITLSTIYQQMDLEGVEVIVIDNGSTDNTADICATFAKEYLPALKYQFEPEPGLLSGRHAGASLATGEILCFIDDDGFVAVVAAHNIVVKHGFNIPAVFFGLVSQIP